MRNMFLHGIPGLVFLSVTWMSPAALAQTAGQPTLEQRLTRLERLVDTNTLLEILQDLERLQREVQELRGELELQSHTLSQLQQHQRELYLDVDRRLQQLGSTGVSATLPATETGEAAPTSADALVPPTADTPSASPTSAKKQATPVTTPPGSSKEQDAYKHAFNLLKEGRYNQAITAFQDFVAEYPRGEYADNAQYWLGEAYYVTRQFQPAMQTFEKLVEAYPDSPKLTHALLKVGYIHDELGQWEEAQRVLTDVMNRYPNTTAGRLAQDRLQRMRGARQ